MADRKPKKTTAKKTSASSYDRIWRPASKGSEGPKKSTKAGYSRTWRPASKASEGPKKSMPRAKKK